MDQETITIPDAESTGNGQYYIVTLCDTDGHVTGYAMFPREDGLQVGSSPSLTVGSQDTSSNTEGSSNTQEVNAEVIDGMHFLASQAVLIVAVFLCFGAIAVRTLIKAFEK